MAGPAVTTKRLSLACLGAALVSLLGLLVGLTDPVYYAPVTSLDYAGAVLNTLGPLATAMAMLMWWQVAPLGRRALLIPIAATGAVVLGLGNFLGDIAGLQRGDDLFFYGGAGFFAASLAAGVLVLSAANRWRWSGLLPLVLAVGIGLDSAVVWVVGWLAFALALWTGLLEERARA